MKSVFYEGLGKLLLDNKNQVFDQCIDEFYKLYIKIYLDCIIYFVFEFGYKIIQYLYIGL